MVANTKKGPEINFQEFCRSLVTCTEGYKMVSFQYSSKNSSSKREYSVTPKQAIRCSSRPDVDGLIRKLIFPSKIRECFEDHYFIRYYVYSKYCLKAERNHTSNNVFFIYRKNGKFLSARCYSKKCKDISDIIFPLPEASIAREAMDDDDDEWIVSTANEIVENSEKESVPSADEDPAAFEIKMQNFAVDNFENLANEANEDPPANEIDVFENDDLDLELSNATNDALLDSSLDSGNKSEEMSDSVLDVLSARF